MPRNFFMIFFEETSNRLKKGIDLEVVFNEVVQPYIKHSYEARNEVIMPPLTGSGIYRKVDSKFSRIFESLISKNPKPWINPFLGRIKNLCEKSGTSPYFRG